MMIGTVCIRPTMPAVWHKDRMLIVSLILAKIVI